MNQCVFLDRDGVLNTDAGTYTYELDKFHVVEGTQKALSMLKDAGYLLIVITNQAGIAKGLYTEKEVFACHHKLQKAVGGMIDDVYFSPYHPIMTESLSRKPNSLLFEKAIAKYAIDVERSWMVGDKERDLIPARNIGIRHRVLVTENKEESSFATHVSSNLLAAVREYILPVDSDSTL